MARDQRTAGRISNAVGFAGGLGDRSTIRTARIGSVTIGPSLFTAPQRPIVVQTYVGTPVTVLRGEPEPTLRCGTDVLNTRRSRQTGGVIVVPSARLEVRRGRRTDTPARPNQFHPPERLNTWQDDVKQCGRDCSVLTKFLVSKSHPSSMRESIP